MQELLAPILLRRMKEDVEKLPEKEEIVVWVQLTPEQHQYYRWVSLSLVHLPWADKEDLLPRGKQEMKMSSTLFSAPNRFTMQESIQYSCYLAGSVLLGLNLIHA
jgi:SNF2 family DNA or RNA helicase